MTMSLRERLAQRIFTEGHLDASVTWGNAGQFVRNVYYRVADDAIAETLSVLAERKLRIVPEAMTENMIVFATEDWLCHRAMEDRTEAIWVRALDMAPSNTDALRAKEDQ